MRSFGMPESIAAVICEGPAASVFVSERFDVPVLVMRETTERREVVDAGGARLVGMNAEGIVSATLDIIDNDVTYRRMASVRNPFGDGTASRQIVDIIAERMAGVDANAKP